MDAEVVCLVKKGVPDFDMLHSRPLIIWRWRVRSIC
jgi:hypothetical protein